MLYEFLLHDTGHNDMISFETGSVLTSKKKTSFKSLYVTPFNSTPHSWRHKRARKELLDWYSDKQQVMSLKNTLLESSSQKTRSPIFPCPYSRASCSQVQLHLDTRFLGNSNSPLIRTKSYSLGFTSYIYCKFNFENPKPRLQQCFVAPFLCISPVINGNTDYC